MKNNGLPPRGIPYVIVKRHDRGEGRKSPAVKPGQPIRFPVEAKGRFEPVTANEWLGAHSINVPDMHGFDDTGASKLTKPK